MLGRRVQYLENAMKITVSPTEYLRETGEKMQSLYEATQHVYGRVQAEVLKDEDSSEVVAKKGDTVVLVYPMEVNNGRTTMNLKRVNAHTAELRMHSVCVYDPDESPERLVAQFTLLPDFLPNKARP